LDRKWGRGNSASSEGIKGVEGVEGQNVEKVSKLQFFYYVYNDLIFKTMGNIERFEDIIAWQAGRILGVELYREFEHLKDFDFRSQMRKAAISITNNISEGFAYGRSKDFSRFLRYAYGSANEVKSMCYLAFDIGYLNENKLNYFKSECDRVSFLIRRLREGVERKPG